MAKMLYHLPILRHCFLVIISMNFFFKQNFVLFIFLVCLCLHENNVCLPYVFCFVFFSSVSFFLSSFALFSFYASSLVRLLFSSCKLHYSKSNLVDYNRYSLFCLHDFFACYFFLQMTVFIF